MSAHRTQEVLEIVRQIGVVRPRDLRAYGIPPNYLYRLYQRGLLERVSRGLYG